MTKATQNNFHSQNGKVRAVVAAIICAVGFGIALGMSTLLAAVEPLKCPYTSVPCSTTGNCIGDILNSMVVPVDYNGGSTPGLFGCGNMPAPTGEGTVPCGPDEPANCSG